ncbi:MAG: DUF2214 domain-containing protein [Pseudomonadota bacterium]
MDVLGWIESWPGAVYLRASPDAYMIVNAVHILGIALLVGAVLPMDLRLIGFFPGTPLRVIVPFLSRAAGTGLALAAAAGMWLFSVDPAEYLANPAFRLKLALLGTALVLILVQHRSRGYQAAIIGLPIQRGVRVVAALSALVWLAVLLCGRAIGFL